MAGLVPDIHVFMVDEKKTWMAGTSPGMTKQLDVTKQKRPRQNRGL
jgi:hypothetical protein